MKIENNVILYDKTNPVIYDNDCHCDVFTDELLMALASAGEIQLKGLITTTPENVCVNNETYELDAAGREEMVRMARRSGMRNIPDAFRGPSKPLLKPNSGRIEDTMPIDTPGSRLIVEEALKASPDKPLVLVMGAPLTVVADAYLLDNSIVDRVIVAWLGGTLTDINDYNGVMDRWAAYIVVRKFQMVQFPLGIGMPQVDKTKFNELPDTELRQFMLEKRLPHVNQMPKGLFDDGDAQPAISIICHKFVEKFQRMSFDRWGDSSQGLIPKYKEDPNGNIIVVTEASKELASQEWWKAISTPEAWGGEIKNKPKEQRNFYAPAFPIGKIKRIEAADFDHGGEGVAYHSGNSSSFEKIYRHSNVEVVQAFDSVGGYNMGLRGGYCITNLSSGDWFEYTINVDKEGLYDLGVRVACEVNGGSFHIEFEGINSQPFKIDSTGGPYHWETIIEKGLFLKQGRQVMRLCADSTGEKGVFGKVICIQITSASE